ncbi:MAG: HAMP domain-containing histidine kinase, partial [Flavobacteriales bacterium]|nr:HAMP domain-containing histidine kinase [Flavobacteriales bacterium]
FPVEVSLNHFEVDGERFVMGLVTDVTLRKRAEHELAATLSDLEARVEQRTGELRQAEHNVREALERERELNELKSRFVSMASHEFRTPLSTIMSSVDLIGRYTDDARNEKVGKHVDRIRGKVRELTGILNDFLSLDKLEQGLVACHPAPFDVLDLCIGLIEEMRTLAKPGQAVHFDHAGEVREACTDRQMLSNVVSNLLSNAIKYSPEDRPIHLRTAITNGMLSIQVEDQGIGIPEKDQVHLFERFFRAGNTVSIQGTGLGLNIVRKYLDMMGGSIRFDSREGAGTTFFVEIPMTSESPH